MVIGRMDMAAESKVGVSGIDTRRVVFCSALSLQLICKLVVLFRGNFHDESVKDSDRSLWMFGGILVMVAGYRFWKLQEVNCDVDYVFEFFW